MMEIEKDRAATLNYVLKDNQGNIIDQSENGEFVYLHGANNIIPGLEQALSGKKAGDQLQAKIAPADAYGEKNPEAVQQVPRDMFPDDTEIAVGMEFHASSPEGQPLVVTIVEVEDEHVVVDGNHPLAGVELNFDVTVVDVREASAEELEHGHIHGPGGHHH